MSSYRALMYSFKGGAGRTVTTANVAYLLATQKRQRVVVIDLDVESAGASVLFEADDRVEKGDFFTVQDVLRGGYTPRTKSPSAEPQKKLLYLERDDFGTRLWPKLNIRIWPEGDDGDGPYLRVVPARRILRSADEATGDVTGSDHFDLFLQQVEGLVTAPDIILFDSASGIQSSALMALERADAAFVFARWSRQFVKGTVQFVEENVCSAPGRNLDGVFVVPTAVPSDAPVGKMRIELAARRKQLEDSIKGVNIAARNTYAKTGDWVKLFDPPVREAHALKWDDKILCKEGDEYIREFALEGVLSDYGRIADTILNLASARAEARVQ